jgi:hypothetical protein
LIESLISITRRRCASSVLSQGLLIKKSNSVLYYFNTPIQLFAYKCDDLLGTCIILLFSTSNNSSSNDLSVVINKFWSIVLSFWPGGKARLRLLQENFELRISEVLHFPSCLEHRKDSTVVCRITSNSSSHQWWYIRTIIYCPVVSNLKIEFKFANFISSFIWTLQPSTRGVSWAAESPPLMTEKFYR